MRGFNELKEEALRVLEEKGELNSSQISAMLMIKEDNAQMLLLRIHRQGLVSRVAAKPVGKRGRRPYRYVITDRGRARLEYYEEKG